MVQKITQKSPSYQRHENLCTLDELVVSMLKTKERLGRGDIPAVVLMPSGKYSSIIRCGSLESSSHPGDFMLLIAISSDEVEDPFTASISEESNEPV